MTPIFLIGHPRSGSTLLQRLLNSVEGIRIYGEHGGALHHVAGAWRSLCVDLRAHYHGNATEAFIDAKLDDPTCLVSTMAGFQSGRILGLCREFIESLGNPFNKVDVRWGFKEVRYGMNENVVNMILDLFPKAQIVFTTRNPYEFCRSMKSLGWIHDFSKTVTNWKQQMDSFSMSLERHSGQTYILPYGANDQAYTSLFQWLGLAWTDEQRAILYAAPVGASHPDPKLTAQELETIYQITKVEPPTGNDPVASSLPRTRSTN